MDTDQYQRIMTELAAIRAELHDLRGSAEDRGRREFVEGRMQELEVEQRLMSLQEEVEQAMKPKKRHRFRRNR